MPPLPAIEGVVKLVFQFSGPQNQVAACILHVGTDARVPVTSADFSTITSSLGVHSPGTFTYEFANTWSSEWDQTAILLTDLGALHQQAAQTGFAGGRAAAGSLPPQCTTCISWKANSVSWRGGRFRTYTPGTPNSALAVPNDAALTAAWRSTIDTAGNNMRGAVPGWTTSVPYRLGAVSYINKAANPTPPHYRSSPLWFPFLGNVCHGRLDSQRRRSGKESTFPTS